LNEDSDKLKLFELKIYAEDGVFYEGDCYELIIPCEDGEKAFLHRLSGSALSCRGNKRNTIENMPGG
jgi:hypothetical protein